ncbi:hypothetical protein BVRB_3g055140 [Beta vulgaris subsp. vulgaris]|nr:hypothetical protein BVRB_3g055140 [Beta vulgaris subsp. vulgaris]
MGKLRSLLIMTMMSCFVLLIEFCSCSGNSNSSSLLKLGCTPSERKALLDFKHSLTIYDDQDDVWSSWKGEDCCIWRRVRCDPATGHVVELHLHGFSTFYERNILFEAQEMESSLQHLFELNHLEHLDVSINNFTDTKIPKLMGSMKQLRYLNLSHDYLSGVVPHQLGNLTNLRVLDLGVNDVLTVDSLKWVFNLRKLRYLDLSSADLSQAHDWIDSLIYGPFPSLRELHLSTCSLPTYSTHSSLKNSSLRNLPIHYLDLSHNDMNGRFPHFIQNLTSIEYLDLTGGNLGPQVPRWLGKLKSLTHLHLGDSGFESIEGGNLWEVVQSLCSLKSLDLSSNQLQGNLSEPRVNSSTKYCTDFPLELLDLSANYRISGHIPDWLQEEFLSLKYLSLEINNISGVIPTSIGMLLGMEHFDISNNMISGEIPKTLGMLSSMVFFDISNNMISGHIPKSLGMLSSMVSLDISHNMISGKIPMSLGTLSSMEKLDISYNNISGEIPKSLEMLSSMVSLDISNNMISGKIPNMQSSMVSLLISHNMISGEIPMSLSMLSSMENLDISFNNISGEIPKSLGMLSSMVTLDISNNMISGEIPKSLGMLSFMVSLDISHNMISGEIPISLGMLSSMEKFDISYNPLEAAILSESHFVNLSSLTTLHMSQTFLTMKLPSDWVPPFQLQELHADSIKINGPFPHWIKTQKALLDLSFKNASINGDLPKWFQRMDSLLDVDFSNNQITGCPIFPLNFYTFEISNNSLSCLFLTNDRHKNSISNSAYYVDLSNNNISGKLPENLYDQMPSLEYILLSNNKINGSIPKSMCLFTSLRILDLQKNRLSGTVPDCWSNSSNLEYVYLSSNKLSGNIPCFNPTSNYLHLNDNMLSGEVPSCLAHLSGLTVLDLGENEFSGEIPMWLTAKKVPYLQILRMRSNKLKGNIPKQLCSLSQLQLLDFGHNYLTGTIPNCLSNLTGMMQPVHESRIYTEQDGVMEVIQGIERRYTTNLGLLISIDLSCNNFVGSIPDGITNLRFLLSLNLSYNQITGLIPNDIGGLKSLVSLDFSRNKLHGIIPTSMADLYALEHIDLSYNNFSGQIPTGRQLQTLDDPSKYAGNPYLCGDPLPKKCKNKNDSSKGSGDKNDTQGEGDKDMHEKMWFCLIVMSGFATGFWGVVGTLVLKKSWRHALFRRVEDAQDWLYVAIVVRMAKLKKKGDASSD